MSDPSDTEETEEDTDKEAVLDALATAAEAWRERRSALHLAAGSGSAQEENLQAAFDGVNNRMRQLLKDANELGTISQDELIEATKCSQQELDAISKSG